MRTILLVLVLISFATPVLAADGVLEINQTCASGPGCFPGDDPGFPVRITSDGSYVLTSNLTVTGLASAITTQLADSSRPDAIDVSIDLNGFTIAGPTTCSGTPLVCSLTTTDLASASGVAILSTSGARGGRAHVRNGTVRGMPGGGVVCSGACVVSDVIAVSNGFVGVYGEGTIRDVHAIANGSVGIGLLNYGTVESSVARESGGDGFFGGGVFVKNLAEDNEGFGIFANPGSVIENNMITGNENGLRCSRCTANNNTFMGNTTAGINFANSPAAYGGNLLDSNGSSVVNAGSAVSTTPNVCPAASPCP